MHLRRLHRPIVALITAALVLLCQTAFAVQACALSYSPGVPAVSAAPCHEMAHGGSTPSREPAATSGCEASKAIGEVAKVPAFSMTDLPVFALAPYETTVVRLSSSDRSTVNAVCSSPPLTLLHCRFLN